MPCWLCWSRRNRLARNWWAFAAVARVLGGVELTGFWAAVKFTLFVGFTNARLWLILAQ